MALVRRCLLGLVCALALAPVARAEDSAADPHEALNRRVHAFNAVVRARLLAPAAEAWMAHTSPETRQRVSNTLATLAEPITAASSLAVGDLAGAGNAAARFGINATLGLGGAQDAAASLGYPRRSFAVADALCHWGVPAGPYLVLPLLGPSTARDAGAMLATSALLSQGLGPDAVLAWSTADALVGYSERHAELERVEAQSLDAYAVYRSAYLQRRAATCVVDR